MIKVNKKQVIYTFYCIFLLILSCFLQNVGNSLIFAAAFLPIVVIILLDSVANKNWLYLCFFGLSVELHYVMVLCICIIKAPETSWRLWYDREELNCISLQFQMMSILLLAIIYFIALYRQRFKNNVSEIKFSVTTTTLKLYIFMAIYAITILYYLPVAFMGGKRDYNALGNNLILSLFRVCCLLSWILLQNAKGRQKLFLFIESLIGLIVVSLLSINGYRYLLVENAVALLILNITRIKLIRKKNLILIFILVVMFYFLMVFFKMYLTGRSFSSILFNHEKSLFYSLNGVISNIGNGHEWTYLSTLNNILPKAWTGSSDLNTANQIMKYINYDSYLQIIANKAGVNVGGYYLTEAYVNFHEFGICFMTAFFGIVFSLMERIRIKYDFKSAMFQTLYYGLTTQMFSIVYYGSSNYFKFLVYYLIFSFIIFKRFKIIGGKNYVVQ